ncbi:hypothetical protein TYRP_020231 [Tyrophagus putrescentiae]|nr:hypothetical protein TYRP_020231 [Tyrophagus putrescentiae]
MCSRRRSESVSSLSTVWRTSPRFNSSNKVLVLLLISAFPVLFPLPLPPPRPLLRLAGPINKPAKRSACRAVISGQQLKEELPHDGHQLAATYIKADVLEDAEFLTAEAAEAPPDRRLVHLVQQVFHHQMGVLGEGRRQRVGR